MQKNILRIVETFISVLLITLAGLLSFSIAWMFKTWTNLSMEELVFHLEVPLEGTNEDMIIEYIRSCAVPTVIIFFAAMVIIAAYRKKKEYSIIVRGAMICSLAIMVVGISYTWKELDIGNYIKNQNNDSNFIEQYYVNPEETSLTFPETKRNLIYIFLESMETTYSDQANGGAFEQDIIPELTQIAQENEDFSGTDTQLNGGEVFPGSTWTMGAMFSQTSGLPLNVSSIGANDMDTQERFMPGLTTLGDILEENGYSQTLMIGSNARFGGRELYFADHGNYDIEDYNYAIEQGWIPSDYSVWWGYEDQKLFQFAENKLQELSTQDQPFNLTLLTVDTHFEDGYVCDLCQDEFGEQYADVMACSSRQVAEFISWIQQQDFYSNTTIVISGDHLTMDSDFCESVSDDYTRRTYTAVINPAVEVQSTEKREYSTLDLFPTTLAAMGVQIDGDRLGLGTNLFSNLPTLTESIGYAKEASELKKKSKFVDEFAQIDETSEELLRREEKIPSAAVGGDAYDPDNHTFRVNINRLKGVNEEVESIGVNVWTVIDKSDTQWIECDDPDEDGGYYIDVDPAIFDNKTGNYYIQACLNYTSGESYKLGSEFMIVVE